MKIELEIIEEDHTRVVLKNAKGDTLIYNPFHQMGLEELIQGAKLASDGDLAGVSISFWGGLIQKLRDKHGCIIWVSPVSDEKTDKVIGWYYEGEWLLEKGILPNTFYNNTWHQSANAAEKAAVEWACKEIGIEVSALVDEC